MVHAVLLTGQGNPTHKDFSLKCERNGAVPARMDGIGSLALRKCLRRSHSLKRC